MGTEIDRPSDTTAAERTAYIPKATAGDSDVGSYLRVVATYRRRKGPQQDRHGGLETPDNRQKLQQHGPRVPRDKHYEGGARGNAQGHGHWQPGHGDGQGQRRDIDLLARRGPSDDAVDNGKFDIDAGTGQLMVKTVLDFEGTTDTGDGILINVQPPMHAQSPSWWLTRPALTPPPILPQALPRSP